MAARGLLFHSGELVRVEKGRQAVPGSLELIQRMCLDFVFPFCLTTQPPPSFPTQFHN